MKVICRSKYLSKEQNIKLGYCEDNATGYELSIGQEYIVLGINVQSTGCINNGVTLLLRDDIGRCAFVPICLVEISDAVPSALWRSRKSGEHGLCLWPEEFFQDYFFDDLSNGVREAVMTFDLLIKELNEEDTVKP